MNPTRPVSALASITNTLLIFWSSNLLPGAGIAIVFTQNLCISKFSFHRECDSWACALKKNMQLRDINPIIFNPVFDMLPINEFTMEDKIQ